MLAGLIVSLVGLGIVMLRALQIPGHWIPLGVGLTLLLVGAVRGNRSGAS